MNKLRSTQRAMERQMLNLLRDRRRNEGTRGITEIKDVV